MAQVLLRALALLRRAPVLAVGVALGAGGSALVLAVPILGVPGYELASIMAIAMGLLGGIVGAAAAAQERRIIQGRDPRPAGAQRSDDAHRSAGRAIAAAFSLNTLFIVPPFIVATVHAVASTRCDPFAQVAFYPLIVLPSALLASACGALCCFLFERRWASVLAYVALLLLSAAATAWPLLFGPQAFAFNHFGGFLPGPLYDEALSVQPALLWFRLLTLLLAALVWLLIAVTLSMRDGALTWPHLRPGSAVLLVAILAAVVALEQRAAELGFRANADDVAERLGGLRQTEHFVLHFPREKPRDDVDRLVRDAEFRYSEVAEFLGSAPPDRIHVFVYRSPEEKRALVGASHTQFAKPWRLEVHVNDSAFPHPSLKHELVHAMAAPFGEPPLHVTARFKLWPLMGIIEGLAVAGDNPVDELTLHEWAAAMRRENLAPDVRRVLGPAGFYETASARAYTTVGSFLRYLADQYGPEKLMQLYRRADFQAAYGRSLDDLATEWERYLGVLPLNEAAVNQAFGRFRQASIFARPCAREVADDQARANDLLASDPQRSLELYERCSRIQPDEPAFYLGRAAALTRLGHRGDALGVLDTLEQRVQGQPALLAELDMAKADLLVRDEKTKEQARAALTHALSLKVSDAVDRTARVKLAAIDSASSAAMWSYFRPGAEDLKLLELKEALDRDPKNGFLAYLLGRRLSGAAPRLALGYLRMSLASDPPETIRREALRLEIEAAYLAGDCDEVRHVVDSLPDFGVAFKERASEWRQRCVFEDRLFHGPLVPSDEIH